MCLTRHGRGSVEPLRPTHRTPGVPSNPMLRNTAFDIFKECGRGPTFHLSRARLECILSTRFSGYSKSQSRNQAAISLKFTGGVSLKHSRDAGRNKHFELFCCGCTFGFPCMPRREAASIRMLILGILMSLHTQVVQGHIRQSVWLPRLHISISLCSANNRTHLTTVLLA